MAIPCNRPVAVIGQTQGGEVKNVSGTVYYRVVQSDPPQLEDFMSPRALGRTLGDPSPQRERPRRGVSLYDTDERALKKARGVPLMGDYVAKLVVHVGAGITAERTTNSTGHHTLWGPPEQLLRCWDPPLVAVHTSPTPRD